MKPHRVSVALLCAVAACSSGSPDRPTPPTFLPPAATATSTPPIFVPPEESPSPLTTAPPATQTTQLGSRLTLERSDDATVDVNVTELIDPATGGVAPPDGFRWIALRVEISNPGGPTYAESPLDAARLIDPLGKVSSPYRNEPVQPGFGESVSVRAGNFVRGFLTFAVPIGDRPGSLRFTPDAGTAPETGEWRL